MNYNPDRFVIIDGVQISRVRAIRDGLIDESGRSLRPSTDPAASAPSETRARSAASARSTTAPASVEAPAPAAPPATAEKRGGLFGKKSSKDDAGSTAR